MPYMSAGTEVDVIEKHRTLALKNDPLHSRIQANLVPVFQVANANTKKKNHWNPTETYVAASMRG